MVCRMPFALFRSRFAAAMTAWFALMSELTAWAGKRGRGREACGPQGPRRALPRARGSGLPQPLPHRLPQLLLRLLLQFLLQLLP